MDMVEMDMAEVDGEDRVRANRYSIGGCWAPSSVGAAEVAMGPDSSGEAVVGPGTG